MSVSKKRHIAKAVTWRIVASTTTALIAWAFGLPAKAIGAVFFTDLVVKFILYYYHERLWYENITFGVKNDRIL